MSINLTNLKSGDLSKGRCYSMNAIGILRENKVSFCSIGVEPTTFRMVIQTLYH